MREDQNRIWFKEAPRGILLVTIMWFTIILLINWGTSINHEQGVPGVIAVVLWVPLLLAVLLQVWMKSRYE